MQSNPVKVPDPKRARALRDEAIVASYTFKMRHADDKTARAQIANEIRRETGIPLWTIYRALERAGISPVKSIKKIGEAQTAADELHGGAE